MFTRIHDVEQLFETLNLFRHGMEGRCTGSGQRHHRQAPEAMPLTNIYDDDTMLVFQAEMAGFTKDDVTIHLHGKHLEIKGEPTPIAPEGYTVHRQDRLTKGFSRSFTLPVEIDAERATSSLENGILTLTLLKAGKAQKREITIQ